MNSNQTTLKNIILFEDYDDVDLLSYVLQNELLPADRKLLMLYAETPNNNISELARQLNSSNYIVKKELKRIKLDVIEKMNKIKKL